MQSVKTATPFTNKFWGGGGEVMCLILKKKKRHLWTASLRKKTQRAAKENIGTNVIAAQCKFPGLSSIKGKR